MNFRVISSATVCVCVCVVCGVCVCVCGVCVWCVWCVCVCGVCVCVCVCACVYVCSTSHPARWGEVRRIWWMLHNRSWTYTSPHVKYSLFLPYFNKNLILPKDFRKTLKFLKNSSSVSRAIPRGQTDEQACRISTVAFLCFMIPHKKGKCVCVCVNDILLRPDHLITRWKALNILQGIQLRLYLLL